MFADSDLILDALGAGKVVGETGSILLVGGLSEDEKLCSDHWRQIVSNIAGGKIGCIRWISI